MTTSRAPLLRDTARAFRHALEPMRGAFLFGLGLALGLAASVAAHTCQLERDVTVADVVLLRRWLAGEAVPDYAGEIPRACFGVAP